MAVHGRYGWATGISRSVPTAIFIGTLVEGRLARADWKKEGASLRTDWHPRGAYAAIN